MKPSRVDDLDRAELLRRLAIDVTTVRGKNLRTCIDRARSTTGGEDGDGKE